MSKELNSCIISASQWMTVSGHQDILYSTIIDIPWASNNQIRFRFWCNTHRCHFRILTN
jgi:hypothetical protein